MNKLRLDFAKKLKKAREHDRDCKNTSHKYCRWHMKPYQMGTAEGWLKGYKAKELEG